MKALCAIVCIVFVSGSCCHDEEAAIPLQEAACAYESLQPLVLTNFRISSSFTDTVHRAITATRHGACVALSFADAVVPGAPYTFMGAISPHFVLTLLKTDVEFQLGYSNGMFLVTDVLPVQTFHYPLTGMVHRYLPSPDYLAWQIAFNVSPGVCVTRGLTPASHSL